MEQAQKKPDDEVAAAEQARLQAEPRLSGMKAARVVADSAAKVAAEQKAVAQQRKDEAKQRHAQAKDRAAKEEAAHATAKMVAQHEADLKHAATLRHHSPSQS